MNLPTQRPLKTLASITMLALVFNLLPWQLSNVQANISRPWLAALPVITNTSNVASNNQIASSRQKQNTRPQTIPTPDTNKNTQKNTDIPKYSQKKYDVAVELMTAIPTKWDIDGLILFAVSGEITNRGSEPVVISPSNLTLLPNSKDQVVAFLEKNDQISQEMADALNQYEGQEGFTCAEEQEDLDCILQPGENKHFLLNQPSFFAITNGTVIAVLFDSKLTTSDNATVTDENTINNGKFVTYYPSNGDPDLTVQGLTGVPIFDQAGKLTGLELAGYIINLSERTFVKDYEQNLMLKINNKVKTATFTFDYRSATSDWKEEFIASLPQSDECPNDNPNLPNDSLCDKIRNAFNNFFNNRLTPETLYPLGKVYFETTIPVSDLKNSALISVTVSTTYNSLTIPDADANGDGRITLDEIRAVEWIEYSQQDGYEININWETGTDTTVQNNTAYLALRFNKPKGSKDRVIQVGEYLPNLWATIASWLEQYEIVGNVQLPKGWQPGSNIPDDWQQGDLIKEICYRASSIGIYCPPINGDWTPIVIGELLTELINTYDLVVLKDQLGDQVVKTFQKIQEFLTEKQALPELITIGLAKMNKGETDEGEIFNYTVPVSNPSSHKISEFEVELNIRGEKIKKLIDGLLPFHSFNVNFSSLRTALTPGGNLLAVTLDPEFAIKERNEFNNYTFQEVVVDMSGNVINPPLYMAVVDTSGNTLVPPKQYIHEESPYLNSFYYISYPFIEGSDMYETGVLKKVQVQSWIINFLDSKDQGKFKLIITKPKVTVTKSKGKKATKETWETVCESAQNTDFVETEWKRYQIVDFGLETCDLTAYKGKTLRFQLQLAGSQPAKEDVMIERFIMVPL